MIYADNLQEEACWPQSFFLFGVFFGVFHALGMIESFPVIIMRRLSKELESAFLKVFRGKAIPGSESCDYLNLRFHLDFCAKYEHPPRDRDSLHPFS